jgi:hypothetical protein
MVRWIAFDDESAEAVVSRFRRGAAEIHPGDAVGAALDLGRPSVVLLPARGTGRVLMARFQPKLVDEVAVPQERPPMFETSGFLGLSDQPIFYEPEPAAKRKWWQKLHS